MNNDNTLKLGSPWKEVRERIKEADLTLTDADLEYKPGQDQELLEHLAKKLNKPAVDVKGWIESLSTNTAQAG